MDTGRLNGNQGGERCQGRQMRSDSESVLNTLHGPFGHYLRLLAEPSGTSTHPSLELVVLTLTSLCCITQLSILKEWPTRPSWAACPKTWRMSWVRVPAWTGRWRS